MCEKNMICFNPSTAIMLTTVNPQYSFLLPNCLQLNYFEHAKYLCVVGVKADVAK
jgi:hypothetical protein